MRLLIVEDEDAIAEPLAEGLRREGFAVDRVATGQAALEAPEPDLVLLDLGLPDIDGFTVCRELRSRSERADHHRHGEGRGDRPRRRPRARRRRLHRQAVRLPRAARAHPGGDPPDERAAGDRAARASARSSSTCAAAARVVDGRELDLTPKEFDLLALLAREPGAVVSRVGDPRRRCGRRPGTGARRRSTSTSPRCARSSATRRGSRPSAASASACTSPTARSAMSGASSPATSR